MPPRDGVTPNNRLLVVDVIRAVSDLQTIKDVIDAELAKQSIVVAPFNGLYRVRQLSIVGETLGATIFDGGFPNIYEAYTKAIELLTEGEKK